MLTEKRKDAILSELLGTNCFYETDKEIMFQKKQKSSWQKTEDMIKYPSRQQNDNKILTQKCLKKLEKSTWQTKRDEIK